MNIGIVGCGFVGGAIINGIEYFKCGHNTYKYDPVKYPDNKIEDMKKCKIVFVCVPTPMDSDGSMSDCFLRDVFNKLKKIQYKGVITIKSTTTPLVVQQLIKDFKTLRITTNPEFLTERVANQDFINTKWVILGGKRKDTKVVYQFSFEMWPEAKYSFVNAEEAMMVKYMCNNWFAVKVSLMNEFYEVAQKIGMNWDGIVKAFATDERVGFSHLAVPGPDNSRGFGGRCVVGSEIAIVNNNGDTHFEYFEDLFDNKMKFNKMLSVNNNNLEFGNLEGVKSRVVDRTIKITAHKGYNLETSLDHGYLIWNDGKFIKKQASKVCENDRIALFKPIINNIDNKLDLYDLLRHEVRFVKLDHNIDEDTIISLRKNKLITHDEKQRLIHGDRSFISIKICNLLDLHKNVVGICSNTAPVIIKRYIEVDRDFGRLIGYYLTEGNFSRSNNKCNANKPGVLFSFGKQESYYTSDVTRILNNYGFKVRTTPKKWHGKDSVLSVSVKHSFVYELIKLLGCGSVSYVKRIPDIILNNKEAALGCLEACIKGDGSVYNGNKSKYITISHCTVSKILHNQLIYILMSLSIIPSVRNGHGKKSKHEYYSICVSKSEFIINLLNNIKLVEHEDTFVRDHISKYIGIKKTPDKFWDHGTYFTIPVRKKEIINRPTTVYSVQVTGNENFVTSGCMLVANCFPKDLNAMLYITREMGIQNQVLEAAWADNMVFRNNKDWLDIKWACINQKEQNTQKGQS